MHFTLQFISAYIFTSTKILIHCVLISTSLYFFAKGEMKTIYSCGQKNNLCCAPGWNSLLSLFLWSLPAIPTAVLHLSARSPVLTLCLCLCLGNGQAERAIPWSQSKLKMDLPLCNIMIHPEKHYETRIEYFNSACWYAQ